MAHFAGLRRLCNGLLHLCHDNGLGFSGGMRNIDMRKFLLISILSLSAALPTLAGAHGCIKGAVVGGVVGHVAGHHGVAGAAIGCAVGHHRAKERDKEATQSQAVARATLQDPATPH
jgi:hypothetical protein